MTARLEASRSRQPLERIETDDLTTAELFDLFGDKYTRRVYEAVAEQPRCGRDVAEAADILRPTAYRRLNALRDAGLMRTKMLICEDGHHRERFEAVSASLLVSLNEDGIDAMVSVSGQLKSRFAPVLDGETQKNLSSSTGDAAYLPVIPRTGG